MFEIEELFTHLIMMHDDDPYVYAAKSVMYGKVIISTIPYF